MVCPFYWRFTFMKFKTNFITLMLTSTLLFTACGGDEAPQGFVNDSGLPTNITYLDEPGIQIHYKRTSGSYKEWALWLWAEGKDGAEYTFNYSDDYGVIAYYPLSYFGNPTSLGFIVKTYSVAAGGDMWGDKVKKDCEEDRFMDRTMLTPDEHQVYHCYLGMQNPNVYTDKEWKHVMNAVKTCEFVNSTSITVQTNNPIEKPKLYRNGELLEGATVSGSSTSWTIKLSTKADIKDSYQVEAIFEDGVSALRDVSVRNLYDADFNNAYNYDGELGALYTSSETTFKVWSPLSSSIKLRIYESGTPTSVDPDNGSDEYDEYEMTKGEKGVFEKLLTGNLEGKYYTYVVTNAYHKFGQEIVDPYAKSAGVNGLRGMIVDFSKTNPEGWDEVEPHKYDRKEMVVYETHVADTTSSETWVGKENSKNRKKFAGMWESGTTYKEGNVEVTTGFDHIKELGVSAVQIIPFFDQANDEVNVSFNWGYNPLNYNVVEGAYSSNPFDGYVRIRELKEMIKAYNEAGMNIIMDVVYNHVNGLTGSNFDVLMPFYYFRYTSTGGASSGSGCGNDTASERYMYRKFMIDSSAFWAKEYKLGGFRFDLMGLHDLETMNQLVKNLEDNVNPNIVVYGEPWIMSTAVPAGTVMASQNNASKYYHYGQFNDQFRDAMVAGGMSELVDKGWMDQEKYGVGTADILNGLKGITSTNTTKDPDKSIAYVTCHDNYTLNDRCLVAGVQGDPEDVYGTRYNRDEKLAKMNVLANSMVLTSQGLSFLLAGEEMLRSKTIYDENGESHRAKKDGVELDYDEVSGNSYNSTYKTNEIDYSLKIKHQDMLENYKTLINFKKTCAGLHYTQSEVATNVKTGCYKPGSGKPNHQSIIWQNITVGDDTYVIYYANGSLKEDYEIDVTGCTLIHDTLGKTLNGNSFKLDRFETIILKK